MLRHLTRLLVAVGDSVDARRTFELYVDLVLKARETQQPEISLQLKRRLTEDVPASPQEIEQQAEDAEDGGGPQAEERKMQTAEAEIDRDDEFIGALIVGSRLLARDLLEPEEAWRYACLAGDVVSNGDRTGRGVVARLRSEVEECKGIVRMAMAVGGESRDVLLLLTPFRSRPDDAVNLSSSGHQSPDRSDTSRSDRIFRSLPSWILSGGGAICRSRHGVDPLGTGNRLEQCPILAPPSTASDRSKRLGGRVQSRRSGCERLGAGR